MTTTSTVGGALRTARNGKGLSLTQVASQAGISTATLSRIETEKQSVDVSLFIVISRILRVAPSDLLANEDNGHTTEESLVAALAELRAEQRVRIVSAAAQRVPSRRASDRLQAKLDGLLAAIDVIREELTAMQREARRRR